MIRQIFNWIIANIEWLFSGIGVTILGVIIGLFSKKKHKKSAMEKSIKIEQNNNGQNNTQIGIQNNYYGENKR